MNRRRTGLRELGKEMCINWRDNGIRSGQMADRSISAISTVILAIRLMWLQLKMFVLDFFQHCGTTVYIMEWTVSETKCGCIFLHLSFLSPIHQSDLLHSRCCISEQQGKQYRLVE